MSGPSETKGLICVHAAYTTKRQHYDISIYPRDISSRTTQYSGPPAPVLAFPVVAVGARAGPPPALRPPATGVPPLLFPPRSVISSLLVAAARPRNFARLESQERIKSYFGCPPKMKLLSVTL